MLQVYGRSLVVMPNGTIAWDVNRQMSYEGGWIFNLSVFHLTWFYKKICQGVIVHYYKIYIVEGWRKVIILRVWRKNTNLIMGY